MLAELIYIKKPIKPWHKGSLFEGAGLNFVIEIPINYNVPLFF